MKKEANKPFIINGKTVIHNYSLRPKHRFVGWDSRCEACRVSKEYVYKVSFDYLNQGKRVKRFPIDKSNGEA